MNKKQTILKIEGKEYSLIWEPNYTSSEGAYYCPELNFYFQRMVSGNYKVYKPHECERECPTSPCNGCGEYGEAYWEEFNCEPPTCEECGQMDCICEEEEIDEEEPEEPEPEDHD